MAGRLADKVALVAGAGPNMGRAVATLFAQEGAKVVVAARSTESTAGTVERIERFGGRGARGASRREYRGRRAERDPGSGCGLWTARHRVPQRRRLLHSQIRRRIASGGLLGRGAGQQSALALLADPPGGAAPRSRRRGLHHHRCRPPIWSCRMRIAPTPPRKRG